MTSRYEERGVSASKREVHEATRNLDKGLFPGAFCKIVPDIWDGSGDHCLIQHADGTGTKASLGYLTSKVGLGKNARQVWKDLIEDSVVMNIDDVGCVGSTGPFLVSLIINRNKVLVGGEVVKILIESCREFCEYLSTLGMEMHFAGGETADLGDNVRTLTIDNVITTKMKRDDVIDAGRIKPPAFIVGFSSTGQARWENKPNSGIGSNGLTNARHDVLSKIYRVHKETYAPETPEDLIYCGNKLLEDTLPGDHRFTIATALLSPTRTYLPLIKAILGEIERRHILGFIHCSGGGQTKIGKFGAPGITYVKNNLFPVPPLFRFLQEARKLPWHEMYASYNMGHRMEAVVDDVGVAETMIAISKTLGIDAQIVGYAQPNTDAGGREVLIKCPFGEFRYA